MGDHARLSPSAAERWTLCPGSVELCETQPNTSSSYAQRGTAAHKLLEDLLLGDIAIEVVHPGIELEGITLQADDISAVKVAYDYILKRYEELSAEGGEVSLYAESIVYPQKLMGRDDCWGTLDCNLHTDTGFVEILDYKHGAGVPVSPVENKQLLLYAIGAVAFLQDQNISVKNIRITIIQPRCTIGEAVESWDIDINALINHWLPYFTKKASETDKPDAPFAPGVEQCRWCNAKAVCPALANAALGNASGKPAEDIFTPALDRSTEQRIADSLTRDPATLSAESLGFILEMEPLILGWLKAVHEHAHKEMMNGKRIPGFKVVRGRKSKKWKLADDELLETFSKFYRVDGKSKRKLGKQAWVEEKILSPAKAVKEIKPVVGEKTWAKIAENIQETEGAPVIAPLSDKRPAIPVAAEDVFSKIEPDTGKASIPDFLT